MPFGHEEELNGEGVPFRVFVEIGQKRVVAKLLQYESSVEALTQQFGEGGLTSSDVALYGQKWVG